MPKGPGDPIRYREPDDADWPLGIAVLAAFAALLAVILADEYRVRGEGAQTEHSSMEETNECK